MFSEKVKQLRIECNWTQSQVAAHLNIEQSSYAGYESGKRQPRLDTLVKIAELYNVSCDYLLREGFQKSPDSIRVIEQKQEEKEKTDPLPDGGETLIDAFRELDSARRRRLLMMALNLLDDQNGEVAASPLKGTGTDGLGK